MSPQPENVITAELVRILNRMSPQMETRTTSTPLPRQPEKP